MRFESILKPATHFLAARPLLLLVAMTLSACAQSVPALVSVTPADLATFVTVSNKVVFVFDQAMNTDPAIANGPPATPAAVRWFSNNALNPAAFSYAWNGDATVLTCTYAGIFPSGSQINWVLNPNLAPVKLQSQAGVFLPTGTIRGQFITAGDGPSCDADGVPDDWNIYALYSNGNFEQTSAGDPVPLSVATPFLFSVTLNGPTGVSAASLTLPNGSVKLIPSLQYFETHATEASMQASIPAGTYTLKFNEAGKTNREIVMTMPAGAPPVPKFLNFTEAQAVNPSADFTLRWNGIPGAGDKEHVSMYISDAKGNIAYKSPIPCLPRLMPSSATSIVIPAGTLQAETNYTATVLFGRFYYHETNAIPRAAIFGDILRSTRIPLKTTAGGVVQVAAPVFSNARILLNGHPEFTLGGTPGSEYVIGRASNPGADEWIEVGTVKMSPTGVATFEDVQENVAFPRFYRAVAK